MKHFVEFYTHTHIYIKGTIKNPGIFSKKATSETTSSCSGFFLSKQLQLVWRLRLVRLQLHGRFRSREEQSCLLLLSFFSPFSSLFFLLPRSPLSLATFVPLNSREGNGVSVIDANHQNQREKRELIFVWALITPPLDM